MQKRVSKNLLDSALSFTRSSFAMEKPYKPDGTPLYKAKLSLQNFFVNRSIETEFVDYKRYYIQEQFGEIYEDLYKAYRRGDKVIVTRSSSEGMRNVSAPKLIDYLATAREHERKGQKPVLQECEQHQDGEGPNLLRQ